MHSREDLLNTFLACIHALLKINFGRYSLPHMPIRVDKSTCFQRICCMCSNCMCHVAFELYHSYLQGIYLCISILFILPCILLLAVFFVLQKQKFLVLLTLICVNYTRGLDLLLKEQNGHHNKLRYLLV